MGVNNRKEKEGKTGCKEWWSIVRTSKGSKII